MSKILYQYLTNRVNLFYIFLIVFPILFPKLINEFFEKYVNDFIFNKIDSSPQADIIFFFIIILFSVIYLLKCQLGYHLDKTRTTFLFIITFWYLIIRNSIAWGFTSLYISECIKYSDLVLFFSLVNLLYWVLVEFKLKSIKSVLIKLRWIYRKLGRNNSNFDHVIKSTKSNRFIPEKTNPPNEILGRTSYAKSIALNIANSYPLEKESYAIAITGKWGTGKTTFLKLIQKELIKQGRIIIEFHPWRNHESKNLINNFFDLLNNELGEFDPQLRNKLSLYAKQLATVDDNIYFKSIDFTLRTLFGSLSIDNLYEDINISISKLNKQIVIFIDDLDRLDCYEIAEVIRLIRSSSNFRGLVFVVAYDKDFVVKALQNLSSGVNDTFLEKIILAEFSLPAFEEERLYNYFKESLMNSLDSKYHEEVNDYFELQSEYVNGVLKKCIFSVRDVTRFINQFKINFLQIESQVLFCDFLNLELIKYKHFEIYKFLEQNLLSILTPSSDYYVLPILNEDMLTTLWNKFNLSNLRDKNIVKSFFYGRQISARNKVESLAIGKTVPDLEWNEKNEKCIKFGANFINYFGLRLADNQLGQQKFNVLLDLNDEDLKIKLGELVESELRQVVQKVTAISPKNIVESTKYKKIQKLKIELQTKVSKELSDLLESSFLINFKSTFKAETLEILEKEEFETCLNKINIIEKIRLNNPNNKYINIGYIEEDASIAVMNKQYAFYFKNIQSLPENLPILVKQIEDSNLLPEKDKELLKNEIRVLYDRWPTEFYKQFLNSFSQDEYSLDKILYDVFEDENDFRKFITNLPEKQQEKIMTLKSLMEQNNWRIVYFKMFTDD